MNGLLDLINSEKVDSRLKGYKGAISHPTLQLERTFCIVCGGEYGWISKESSEHIRAYNVVVVCDSCHQSLGELPLERADIQLENTSTTRGT